MTGCLREDIMKKAVRGGFTLPGESGYEELTLKLAQEWGADVIRDSDGTTLSQEIIDAGYDIYSTICIIRDHNTYAHAHPEHQQQTILMTGPVWSDGTPLAIELLDGYSREQFSVNTSAESVALWQVFDRTAGGEVSRDAWTVDAESGKILIKKPIAWHRYTVNFFAWRIWEEISMYNHVTNSWQKQHLMQLDPRYPEVRAYFAQWLEAWCASHPATTVIRFTSLFYNFVWIWGNDTRRRDIYSDWASYDFTTSPRSLAEFERAYGYALTLEDFMNKGDRHPNHMAWPSRMRDYQAFIMDFVADQARVLVDIAHAHGKKAYVFYDDSWVGMEPYGPRFKDIGFDGLIKCVFSGFEARLCAGVEGVGVHELRLHPYLFPVGLGGAPSFSPGGNPAAEAWTYWTRIRRALLCMPVDRIGLGGYLHLTEDFPDFVTAITDITDEFHRIRSLHAAGGPLFLPVRIGILTSWGKLRTWTCGGHYHEHPDLDLINVLESLSGIPFPVEFLSFDDIRAGKTDGIDILINAGFAGSAWSGGEAWADEKVVSALSAWVAAGGVFLGINEPSSAPGGDTRLRMAHVLGMDIDDGRRLCHGAWTYTAETDGADLAPQLSLTPRQGVYLTDHDTQVLAEADGRIVATRHVFGQGTGLYLSSYTASPQATWTLRKLLLHAAGITDELYTTDNPLVECTFFPAGGIIALANQDKNTQKVTVATAAGARKAELPPYGFTLLTE